MRKRVEGRRITEGGTAVGGGNEQAYMQRGRSISIQTDSGRRRDHHYYHRHRRRRRLRRRLRLLLRLRRVVSIGHRTRRRPRRCRRQSCCWWWWYCWRADMVMMIFGWRGFRDFRLLRITSLGRFEYFNRWGSIRIRKRVENCRFTYLLQCIMMCKVQTLHWL